MVEAYSQIDALKKVVHWCALVLVVSPVYGHIRFPNGFMCDGTLGKSSGQCLVTIECVFGCGNAFGMFCGSDLE